MPELTRRDVREIIEESVCGMRGDVGTLKSNVARLEVLYEAMDEKIDTVIEITTSGFEELKEMRRIDGRVTKLEDTNDVLKPAVISHSREIAELKKALLQT